MQQGTVSQVCNGALGAAKTRKHTCKLIEKAPTTTSFRTKKFKFKRKLILISSILLISILNQFKPINCNEQVHASNINQIGTTTTRNLPSTNTLNDSNNNEFSSTLNIINDGSIKISSDNSSENENESEIILRKKRLNVNESQSTTSLQMDADISVNTQLKLPLYMRIVATFACLVIFIVGVTGNLLVPLVVIKTKYLRNSTNLFLINLSMADLLVLLVCMPIVFVELHSRPETWLLGESMCK